MRTAAPRLVRTIEVIGIPGAGKTTLLQRLELEWLRRGLAGPQLLRPIRPGGSAALLAAGSLASRLLLRSLPVWAPLLITPDGRWLLAKIAYRMAGLSVRGPAADGAIMLDSGLLQPLVSFPAEFRRDRRVRTPVSTLLPLLPMPAGLLHVRAAPELALSRYLARQAETGRRAGISPDIDDFQEAADVSDRIATACSVAGSRVLTIDAGAGAAGRCGDLATKLATLVSEVTACPGP